MPRFDGTGPWNQGQSTGRGLGRCNPNSNLMMGRGRGGQAWGCGRGYGFGGGSRFMQNLNTNNEDMIESLKKQKEEIEQKISILENAKDES